MVSILANILFSAIIFIVFIILAIPGLILSAIIIFLIMTGLIKTKKPHKILTYVIICGCISILIFSPVLVLREKPNDLYTEMQKINDNQKLIGLSKEQVVTLLGEPKEKYSDEYNWRYNAGKITNGYFWCDRTIFLDCEYAYELRISFDENDKVKSTSIKCIP